MKKRIAALVGFSLLFLAACGSVTVKTDITAERAAELEKTVAHFQDAIKNWQPVEAPAVPEGDSEPAADFEINEAEYGITLNAAVQADERPPYQYFISLGTAQTELGRLSDAIRTYKQALKHYEIAEVAWNNLGRLYDRIGKYDKAIAAYQNILDELNNPQYYLDVANSYIMKGDPDGAQKAYNQYRLATNNSDPGIEMYIHNLREKR